MKLRVCKDCGKPEDEVPWVFKRGKHEGLRCKACTNLWHKKAWHNTPGYAEEKRTKRNAKYSSNEEYRTKIIAHCAAKQAKRYAEDPEFRAKKKLELKVRQQANRALHTFYTVRYQLAKLQRTPKWAETEEHQFFIEEAYQLATLRQRLTGIKQTVDHIIPIRGKLVSGLHVWQNLRVLSKSENSSKTNKYQLF